MEPPPPQAQASSTGLESLETRLQKVRSRRKEMSFRTAGEVVMAANMVVSPRPHDDIQRTPPPPPAAAASSIALRTGATTPLRSAQVAASSPSLSTLRTTTAVTPPATAIGTGARLHQPVPTASSLTDTTTASPLPAPQSGAAGAGHPLKSTAAGVDDAKAAEFQQLTEQALTSLEVSSVGSNANSFALPGGGGVGVGGGAGSRAALAPAAASHLGGAANLSSNLSFTQQSSMTHATSNLSAVDVAMKYVKVKQKVESQSFQLWHLDSRSKLVSEEALERAELVNSIQSGMAGALTTLRHRLDDVVAEVEAIQEAHRDPGKRLLELLGGAGLPNDSRERILADVEANAEAAGTTNPEGVLDDEVVVMMLDSYARHRDVRERDLQQQLSQLSKKLDNLEAQEKQSVAQNSVLSEQLSEAQLQLRSRHETHADQWLELKAKIEELEKDKKNLLETTHSYEEQLAAAHDRITSLTTKEADLLAECRKGEDAAVKSLVERHEAEKLQWKQQLSHLAQRKEFYKDRCTAMAGLQDECLRGRSLIQSELLELQEAKRAMQTKCTSAVSTLKLQMEKERVKAKREHQQLLSLKKEKHQKEQEAYAAANQNLSAALNFSTGGGGVGGGGGLDIPSYDPTLAPPGSISFLSNSEGGPRDFSSPAPSTTYSLM